LSQDVDYLLLPRIVCRRVGPDCYFGCPKAIALPDLVRAVMPDIRGAVELLVDDRVLGRSAGMRSVAQALGRQHLWRTALRRASEAQRTADDETRRRGNPLHMFGDSGPPTPNPGVGCRVGIVGHPYLLYDRLLSLDLLNRLGATGAEPVVPWGDGPPRDRTASKAGLPNWLYEADLIQGARALLAGGAVDGLLLVSSFACGTAAVANEVIAREAMRVSTVPVLTVLLDEHTGEAALATRLESFVEVLQRAHT
jgi:predicted nucleotide-binding protein (sugar kinase/HSP70/actin superfamily)